LDLIQAVILGLIQGLTEWLPISSTGHLKLAEYFLNLELPILFDVILHSGTLIVVLFFFREDIKQLLYALARLDFKTEHGRLILPIIVGTIPTVIIGLAFGQLIEATFQTLLPIAIALIACGILLYTAKIGNEKKEDVTLIAALIIGIAQGIAIIPGISRSGATIAIAILIGIKREKAFRFSFLLSIPAILGALALTLTTQLESLTAAGLGFTEIFIGTATAVIVGYLALKVLWKVVIKRKLHVFAMYCWILGIALAVLSLSGF